MEEKEQSCSKKRSYKRKAPPPRTPEDQERRMINLSMKQAEAMLEKGQAPAMVVVHFLKLATERSRLENERLKADISVSNSKIEVMQSQKNSEELAKKAIEAFKSYSGRKDDEDEFDE